MSEVFVIGGNHHNTLGILRSLGYKNIYSNLILIGNDKDPYVKYSRFIKELYLAVSDEEAIKILLNIKHNDLKPVVIACSDGASSLIDSNRDNLRDYCLPGSNIQGTITSMMNKETMSQLARDVGFIVPASWKFEKGGDDDLEVVEYPCISKPLLSKDGHKSDIKICQNRRELEGFLRNSSCLRFQLQNYIEKDFEYQLIGLSLDAGDIVIIPGMSKCIRPCPGTNTGFLHYEPLDNSKRQISLCKDFIKKTGYSGLFSIEFIRDKEGHDYFMEMNFRNDGNSICVTASGINLPYIWYLYCSGGEWEKELASSNFRPVYVMPEFADFLTFAGRSIPLTKWFSDWKKTDQFMEYDRLDPKPFFVEIKHLVQRAFKKVIRNIKL